MATHKTTSTAAQRDFMKGVSWACTFLRRADSLNRGNTGHAQAMFRAGAEQAQLLPEMLALLAASPELIPGANAILVEYLCSSGKRGAGVMNVEAYEAMSIDDFMREDQPDEAQGASAEAGFNVVRLALRAGRATREVDHG